MTIPAPLAFPPTAIRAVSAGAVVGNPIGSSGTRAKALTSAELKAIVEASGISYLPLSGGTLTGPITGTGGLIEQRNGLTAQCLDIFETYTSGTNNGKLRIKATSGGHQIGSARATSGSNRAVQLGHFDAAGTFTSGISVATNGAVTLAAPLACGSINASGSNIVSSGSAYIGSIGNFFLQGKSDGVVELCGASLAGTGFGRLQLGGATSSFPAIKRSGATVHIRLADDSGFAAFECAQVTQVPPTSTITLSTNGQFSIEMTSNTAGNLVYRGSDGTTRRMALTFS